MSSSSSEEDGDEQWKAAINSVASPYPGLTKPDPTPSHIDDDQLLQPQPIKHYQIKAQKVLDDMLEKSLVMVNDSDLANINVVEDDPADNGEGVRLFKKAPVGIVFDYQVELKGPTKKPRILPGEDFDEKSLKFKRKLQAVAIEGTDIIAAAEHARQKSKARLEAKEANAEEAAKREEERVAELKKIRGEKWLPSMKKQVKFEKYLAAQAAKKLSATEGLSSPIPQLLFEAHHSSDYGHEISSDGHL